MKLAIVHDFLNQYGGAERVVEAFHEIFSDAPIYTSIYLPENMPDSFKKMDIRTSFMQKLPFLNKHFKKYLLLYPRAIESFDLNGYDVILSSSSAFAKGAKKGKNSYHICYCYSPMRFVWDYERYMEKENFGSILKKILPILNKWLKGWDLRTNVNVDFFISISKNIQQKIADLYHRESDIIYPPVDTEKFQINSKIDDYFLIVSRLNAYKRIDLVIEAFNKLKLPLRIIGDGPYKRILEDLSESNIKFLGKVSEIDLCEYYSRCRAFIFPGDEDFGIAPVEAQASGRPVIAYAGGGALETVIDEVTGIFFKDKTIESLIEGIRKYIAMESKFDIKVIRENALRFDTKIFKNKIKNYIFERYEKLRDNINTI